MRYKIKVISIGGDLWYKPMYKKFLFWHSIPLTDQFGKPKEYGTYEQSEHRIQAFKNMLVRGKRKNMGSIPYDF